MSENKSDKPRGTRAGVPRMCPTEKAPRPEEERWYAIRVTYSRELRVKTRLNGIEIENYIPMRYAERIYAGRRRRVWVPAIHNLIFVRTTRSKLREIKRDATLPIRYVMDPENHAPAVIPDRQMEDFMAVLASGDEHVEMADPQTIVLIAGDPVRVTQGVFAGIEGRYIRHKGHSKVAVEVCGIAAVLTAYVPLRCIEKLPPKEKNAKA